MRYLRSSTLSALAILSSFALPAAAQKAHGGGAPHPMTPAPGMPPAPIARQDDGQTHAQNKMAERQAKDAGKLTHEQGKAADKLAHEQDKQARKAARPDNDGPRRSDEVRGVAGQRKITHDMEKSADRAERHAINGARHESKTVLRGVRLTAAQRTQTRTIDARFDTQIKELERTDRANDKAGRPSDPALVQRVTALRDQERAELRALLTPAQMSQFDANVTRATTRR